MTHRLVLFGTWFTAEPWRLRIAFFALAMVLALLASLVPNGIVFAGNASGGSG